MEKAKRIPMETIPGAERRNNFYPFLKGYTEEEVKQEAGRCLHCAKPLCRGGCPIENRIPDFMAEVKEGHFEEAYEILSERTCFPDICGTVCPHEKQCEGHCVRGRMGDPVAIGSVERFVGEWAQAHGLTPQAPPAPNGKTAAVVGAGPAGMACAQKLAEAGFAVTVYEEAGYAGGILTWGIPSYRLSNEVKENHIETLRKLGVQFKFNTKVGRDIPLQELSDTYDAVFLGTGAPIGKKMGVPGEDLEGVFAADDFLKAVNLSPLDEEGRRSFPACGRHVIVIGGGNVAMDAARDAVRLKQVESVTIVYRRTEKEMPAGAGELEHAKEEGVVFYTLHNPAAFHGSDGHVSSAELCVMELGEPDSSGRRRPVDTGKAHVNLACDTVILALGFSDDPTLAQQNPGLAADKWGCFQVDDNGKTTMANVYAGGDAVTGADTVVKAMRAGLKAAQAIIEAQ